MSLRAGVRLGRYEIRAPIGAGGMGEVYRARDGQLERDVAIKVLPEHLAESPAALARFGREAKAVAALSHPNILAIFDVGSEEGVSFAVTELLEGETLKQRLDRGAMGWREAVAIGAAVADGLAAAHGKGIIHRDLKPHNIFLTAEGRVKILDFGLARVKAAAAGQEASSMPTETDTGIVMGTAGYMSPEQVRGEHADVASDIFAFGCVLYEMAAGRRAFARETAAQSMAAVLETEPPELGTEIPAAVREVVTRCLEKSPARRYSSAQDLGMALRAAVDSAGSEPRARKSRRWMRAAAPAALLAAGLAYWMIRPPPAIDSLAILPFTNAGADPNSEYLSDGITEYLINSLSQSPALRVTARSLVFRYKGPQVDPQKAGRDLHVHAVLTGRVTEREGVLNIQAELMNVADGAQIWGGQFRHGLAEILVLQREIEREISGKLHLTPRVEEQQRLARRSTENTDAYQLYLKGRYYWNRRNEQALKRAVEYFQQAIDKDPGYALAYAGLADCYALYNSYQVELPRESGPKARAAATKALEIDNTLAQAHASLGMIRMSYEWDWPGAGQELRRAIELDPDYATAHHWYGISLIATGKSDEALASLKRAQELDPLSMIINADLGLAMHFARRDDEAIEQLRKGLEMDANFAAAHRPLGMAYEQKAMFAEAIGEFQKALEASSGNPFALGSLGHAYAAGGQRAPARKALADLLELAKRRYVSPFDIAVVYAGLGENDRALEWLGKATEDRSLEMIFLKVDPRFDGLRGMGRFGELLRRVGLAK